MGNLPPVSLYVHVPFCASKCRYCDFASYAGLDALIPAYLGALAAGLAQAADLVGGRSVPTVYIGGGTPSRLPDGSVDALLSCVRARFSLAAGAEVSVEANPESLGAAKAKGLMAAGVSRLSLGVQSLDDGVLAALGRPHTADMARRALMAAFASGIANVGADMVYGVPGQTFGMVYGTARELAGSGLSHVSCYGLQLEPGTPMWEDAGRGAVPTVTDEDDRDMNGLAAAVLAERGFRRYEISNYALPGRECAHNAVYWEGGDYLGIGSGAHSLLGGKRMRDARTPARYVAEGGRLDGLEVLETLDGPGRMAEMMVLGLRMGKGVTEARFRGAFGVGVMEAFGEAVAANVGEGFMEARAGAYRLTPKGMDLSNVALARFMLTNPECDVKFQQSALNGVEC
ncbi:MAG: radical SAM family heme chaperone HemW [Oscillospiraceae bacterium]|nr:radical SAM family heme chaperone HemW [Oscillospiraceae bacterium]